MMSKPSHSKSKPKALTPKPGIGLGRGLTEIIAQGAKTAGVSIPPAITPNVHPGQWVRQITLSQIVVNPRQPRLKFVDEPLDELVASIQEHGVLQPISVRTKGDQFEIIAGERRWRACQRAGLTTIPAIVKDVSDAEACELALIENLQREDLDSMEEARGYRRLADDFSLTQEQVAVKVGKNRATIANALRLLDLPEEVQSYVSQNRLSAGHAKAILSLSDAENQIQMAREIIKRNLNVRQAEQWSARIKSGANPSGNRSSAVKKSSTPGDTPAHLRAIQEALQQKFGTRVTLRENGTGGQIEIQYYTPGDLDRLLQLFQIQL